MDRIRLPVRVGAAGITLSLLACGPVFAIGWGELTVLVVLVLFLFWPVLIRLARAWNAHQESLKNKRKKP